ncbi:MAG: beta-eliminating lyase-related protein [Anaerolineae bacterium]
MHRGRRGAHVLLRGGGHGGARRDPAADAAEPSGRDAGRRADPRRGPPVNVHFPPTRLVCLENTHSRCGGAVLDAAYMRRVRAVADANHLAVHLDGARLFNAAVALGVPAADLAPPTPTASRSACPRASRRPSAAFCAARMAFVEAARRVRKMVGGGMRQAGVLAAAGLVALDTMVARLADDHAHARRLADGLRALPGVTPAPDAGRTNIVVAALDRPGHGRRHARGAHGPRGGEVLQRRTGAFPARDALGGHRRRCRAGAGRVRAGARLTALRA